jgi:type IV pilus assembly protein PilY1
MNAKFTAAGALLVLAASGALHAQTTVVSENFTGTTTTNSWYFFNGACLTASSATGVPPTAGTQGQVPGCLTSAVQAYYNSTGSPPTPHTEVQVGGYNGAAGNAQTLPDPVGNGALRFTNGYDETGADPYQGYGQNGQILSNWTFPSGQGLQITFTTVSYRGDSRGYYGTTANPGDGADGISFFLTDASQPFYPGAWGGSLGYSCSNTNPPYNGMTGAYLAVGLDEYGNFLNGSVAMPASAWLNGVLNPNPNTIGGDNTYYGYGERPDRIGIRGEGSVNWYTLNGAYGTNPNSSTKPYYPTSLATSCLINGGTYSSSTGMCMSCTSGTYSSSGNQCVTTTYSCATVNGHTYTYQTSGEYEGECTYTHNGTTSTEAATVTSTDSSPGSNYPDSVEAVQKTCSQGTLYNYSTATSPTSAGPTTLTNTVNTGSTTSSPVANILPVLDYAPIPGAYVELAETGSNAVHIATEYAAGGYSRPLAKPIYYQLKLTQNGLLSFWYSLGGANGVFVPVIKSQNITGTNTSGTPSNGPLPANFRFGFGGSDGGASNIHEILCFQAANLVQSASGAGANEKQSAKIETGIQAYFGFYNPNDSTGKLAAYALGINSSGAIVVAPAATWDASCVLTGSSACSTMAASSTTPGPAITVEPPTSREILTQNGAQALGGGMALEWNSSQSPTATQEASLGYGDTGQPTPDPLAEDRLNFLRGVRTNEIPSTGPTSTQFLRKRDSVLGDIQNSSPAWVGPPGAPYSAAWTDRLYSSDTMPENTGTQTYAEFASAASSTNPGGEATRLNVVYVGSNDGMMHGFRTGAFNADGSYNTSAPNDGYEVLAYMPNEVVNDIHEAMDPPDPPTTTTPTYDATLDFTSPSYGHNFFVDSTPDADDLFYGGTWHTWLVSGQGAGGNTIFALDITNPGSYTAAPTGTGGSAADPTFLETNASTLVLGEWVGGTSTYNATTRTTTTTNGNFSCTGDANCSQSLGNTYGTPQVRRMHNGQWAVIFGNGFGSPTGDAGIFIMLVDPTNPLANAPTFYYLSTSNGSPCVPSTGPTSAGPGSTVSGSTAGGNGIGYTASVDLDGDHVIDYIYAGDLQGNLWRFDVTSASPANWAVTCGALFKTNTGQPITTAVVAASGIAGGTQQRLMIIFGTGQKIPATNTTAVSYSMAQEDLYGVWDWNLSYWNSISGTQYASLASSGVSGPLTAAASGSTCGVAGGNLACETISVVGGTGVDAGDRDIDTAATICWAGTTTCGSSAAANQQFGWYLALPGTTPATGTPVTSYEQFIYNPEIVGTAVVINSILPAANSPTSCTIASDQGWTYAVNALTGSALTNAFPQYYDANAAGVNTNATGGSFPIQNSTGQTYLVYQTVLNAHEVTQFNPGANTTAKRLTWIQRR